jgi:glutamine synthetase
MAYLRYKALDLVQQRRAVKVPSSGRKASEYFGENIFGINQMREALSPDIFHRISEAIKKGTQIDHDTANVIALAIKSWALSKGVTHYTHWFQPLTGATAEKHDSFFDATTGMEKFKGSELVQQEPDASSFPSGGIRSTFEARGYTAWDPSSPIFILESTLCIPTVFVSYTGETLDYKAPLLKSVGALDRAATRICKHFDKNITRVTPSLGIEQEYFIIDKALFSARPDLVMSGRTIFGHNPARGQQLDDHYFGSIPTRAYSFMKDFEQEALKLGIPVRTRHNEVAPSQYEVAPLNEDINVATDHNQLLKDLMDKIAVRHDLKVLFHEKPFAELNGSGKHNNWSLITDTGVNLYQPSSSARENLIFLIFFVNTIKAVYEYSDLLRASVASAGNDHRLGANEAPPAIMSVFIGAQMTAVLDELEQHGSIKIKKGENMYMKLGIDKIPEIILDNTDRNRTSPFAFTGNKFEFRAVGSDANVARPMTILSMAVADQLTKFNNELESKIATGREKKIAIVEILRDYIVQSKDIRFEGDGYSNEWEEEARRRGLSNIKSTPRALNSYLSRKSKSLFKRHKVFTDVEVQARNEIMLGNYIMKIQIESRIMSDLAMNHIIPTAIAYQNKLIKNASGLQSLGIKNESVVTTIERISTYIESIQNNCIDMIKERKRVNQIEDTAKRAIAYCDDVKEKYFEPIRHAVDKLELIVDDEDWPLVKYREMLFLK